MKSKLAKILVLLTAVVALVAMMALPALATEFSVLGGQITVSDEEDKITQQSDGSIQIPVKGSLISKDDTTVKITNKSDKTAIISFSYATSNLNSFKINNEAVSGGTDSRIVAPDESIQVYVQSKSGLSGPSGSATLSDFAIEFPKAASNVTVVFDSTKGSVSVNGSAAASGTVYGDISVETGITLSATCNSGATFQGWINEATGALISTSAEFTYKPEDNSTVKPVFLDSTSQLHYLVAGGTKKTHKYGMLSSFNYYVADNRKYIFDDFGAACAAAAADAGAKYVVLLNDGTLPAGSYIIPAGVTMVIPYDTANSVYTDNAPCIESGYFNTTTNYKQPTAYRTLTLAEGASLQINGSLSLPAMHRYANGGQVNGGSPVDKVSFIDMKEGSSITVNKGGHLYAYGYIIGDGEVLAKNGAEVYELFQMMDFRGGNQTTTIKNKVFPVSQYYVQNIEVPLTLEYGAVEKSYTSVTMTLGTYPASVTFIGPSNAMFNLTEGSVTKYYDGSTDRLMVSASGIMNIEPISMSVGLDSLDSSDYVLPINGNITVNMISGSISLKQDIALLPGAELIVGDNATATLNDGNKIYVYDADNWGNYCGAGNKAFIPITYAPGKTYTRTADDMKDAKVVINGSVNTSGGTVYTTEGGAFITSENGGQITVSSAVDAVTYQIIQAKDPDDSEYPAITVNPAKLSNADGSFVSTAKGGTFTYYAETGKWDREDHFYQTVVTAPTCTEKGYTTYTCEACGNSYTDNEVAALGHSYESVVTAPTCENGGYTTHTCSVCDHSYTDSETESLGHDAVLVSGSEPDCENTGLTDGWFCNRCQTTIEAQQEIPALGHNEVVDAAVAATCENPGKTEGKHCDRCGEVLVAQEEVAALGHSYNSVVTAPTCLDAGYTTYTCSACGDSYIGDEIKALGHTEVIDAAVAATCTATGKTEGKHCSVCNEVIVAQEDIAALGHSYDSVVTAPTCLDAGYTTYTCSVCGDSYIGDEIKALGHTEVIDAAVAATCTATGKTEGKHCSVCNVVIVAQEEVAALGHTYVEGKCDVCGEADPDYEAPVVLPAGNAALKFSGANLQLEADLSINFVVKPEVFAAGAYSNPRVVFEITDVYDNTYRSQEVTEYTINPANGRWQFRFSGISPRMMKASVTATLYGTYQGVEYSSTSLYAVTDYCYNHLNKTSNHSDTKFMTLLADLLNFGTAHQQYIGHDVDNLINAEMTDFHKSFASSYDLVLEDILDVKYEVVTSPSASFKGAGLYLSNAVVIRFKVQCVDTTDVALVVSADGQEYTIPYSKENWEPTGEADRYYIYFSSLKARQMSTPVYAKVCRNGVAISNTAQYSIESYAAAHINDGDNLAALMKAMMYYSKAANAYANR